MDLSRPFGGLLEPARADVLAVLLATAAPLTGRNVYALVADRHSLWAVQRVLHDLTDLGLVHREPVGRALVHRLNEEHWQVPSLRAMVDPIAALAALVAELKDRSMRSVVLFGSASRGEATATSDVDLLVLTSMRWDGQALWEDAMQARLGNPVHALVMTSAQWKRAVAASEPVAVDILREGQLLLGDLPTR